MRKERYETIDEEIKKLESRVRQLKLEQYQLSAEEFSESTGIVVGTILQDKKGKEYMVKSLERWAFGRCRLRVAHRNKSGLFGNKTSTLFPSEFVHMTINPHDASTTSDKNCVDTPEPPDLT